MKIIDRYLTKNFLFPLIYCLFIFTFLYIMVDIFGHLDDILKNKVPAGIVYQYYSSFVPLIFVQTAPVAALLAIVYMLSILNKNNELTAFKSCGISIARLLMPVFAIGLMLSLGIFLINEHVVPKNVITSERIKSNYIKRIAVDKKSLETVRNLTVYGKDNRVIYAKLFDPVGNELTEVIILERDKDQRLKRKILAAEASWRDGQWTFSHCIIYKYDADQKIIGNPLVFTEKVVKFPETPQDLLKQEIQLGYMSYKELREYIQRLSGEGGKLIYNLKTELYFKTAVPFVCLIIMLLGIPFAVTTHRGMAMADIGKSVLAGLLYYCSMYFAVAMGKGGILPPLIAAHISNVIFFIAALVMLRRASV